VRRVGPLLLALAVVLAAAALLLGLVDRTVRTAVADPSEPARSSVPSSEPAFAASPTGTPRAGARSAPRSPVPAAVPAASRPQPTSAPPRGSPASPAAASAAAGPRAVAPPAGEPAVAVLTRLERIRATAFATGRVDLLAQVYPAGSPLLTADRRLYARVVPAGGRLVGLAFDHRAAVVRSRTPVLVVLQVAVTQRPADLVTAAGTRRRLPARDLGRLRVVLRRTGPEAPWVVAASRSDGRS